ncbi:hypothetical protein AB0D46_26125 [Streptomyces sp. NPDC048383]|uniref:hypothetical protein n=1 Tax=Streptomyces sp. NPDC048383 TaxID=3155386 RepID=UPI0034469EDB
MIAERKLMVGRLEEAGADWARVLDDYPHVQSGRCDHRVRIMLASLRPHLTTGHARDIYDRGRRLLTA